MKKRVLSIAVGLAGALLVGSSGGSSGSGLARTLQTAGLRAELVAARDAVLDARVAIDLVDLRAANRLLDDARRLLGRADQRLRTLGWNDQGTDVQTALAALDDAQRLVGQLDQRDLRNVPDRGRFAVSATAVRAAALSN